MALERPGYQHHVEEGRRRRQHLHAVPVDRPEYAVGAAVGHCDDRTALAERVQQGVNPADVIDVEERDDPLRSLRRPVPADHPGEVEHGCLAAASRAGTEQNEPGVPFLAQPSVQFMVSVTAGRLVLGPVTVANPDNRLDLRDIEEFVAFGGRERGQRHDDRAEFDEGDEPGAGCPFTGFRLDGAVDGVCLGF